MAYGFKAKLNKFHFDKGGFTKKLDQQVLKLVKGAAAEWLRAAYIRVPIWTGMARGSLKYAKGRAGPGTGQFLAQFLKVEVPIDDIREIRKDKDPFKGGAQARWTLTGSNGKYSFTYNNDVYHYILNEYFDGEPPSFTRPWGSFQAGKAAFDSYIADHKGELPKISEFFNHTEVRFNT